MRTNTLYTIVLIAIIFTCFLTSAHAFQKHTDKFVVVLDAGHGGHDPGNMGNGFKEKDIALNIVLSVGKQLEKNPNIEVVYTRKTDVFVDLFVRGKIANKADADLFVSVHCNSHNSAANGTETFVLGLHANQRNFEVAKKENEVIFLEKDYQKHYDGFDPTSPESVIGLTLMQEDYLDQSILLADMIEGNFTNDLKRKSRGVKQAGFIVLHQTYMPSVLVETGFLTYKPEGTYLNSSSGQSEMSSAIYKAIMSYKSILDQNVGENIYSESTTPMVVKENVPIEEVEVEKTEVVYNNIVFKVQLAASSNKLEPKPFNFNGLSEISREKEGRLYKYFYGYTSDYNKVKELQTTAQKKGYPECFIVAFKDGKRIELNDALKTTAN
ncbi:N-acetylmuramoyl-L-alanine amidase [Subsaxibacter sp. CAU 1640]|uniref:N-acetylmuramoyl-L-alanine amidase family protein n=1 Tax=Subsaxibacter sp. CAU 1640 TaxID=2933271 RepID=UPI002004F657|nr:N-acetylmuramoyl-L-alanine amidase [Subsaxibacter sp. CAU 1640]MCK7590913.1 N-acetylmuramoyl-L-alanine amidase [Subsaxibacter sp. CAU 1640]